MSVCRRDKLFLSSSSGTIVVFFIQFDFDHFQIWTGLQRVLWSTAQWFWLGKILSAILGNGRWRLLRVTSDLTGPFLDFNLVLLLLLCQPVFKRGIHFGQLFTAFHELQIILSLFESINTVFVQNWNNVMLNELKIIHPMKMVATVCITTFRSLRLFKVCVH